MNLEPEHVKKELSELLNECLRSANQDGSFVIKELDLKEGKCIIEFNVVIIPEDNYIGFQGY